MVMMCNSIREDCLLGVLLLALFVVLFEEEAQ